MTTPGSWSATAGVHVHSSFRGVPGSWQPMDAVLGGETYWYSEDDGKVHVTAPGLYGQVVVSAVDVPSATLLGVDGLDDASVYVTDTCMGAVLVAHRGAVYFVGDLEKEELEEMGQEVTKQREVCGLWRLARAADGQREWEGVALLDASELERLTGISFASVDDYVVSAVCGVREMVCCEISAFEQRQDEDDFHFGAWLLGPLGHRQVGGTSRRKGVNQHQSYGAPTPTGSVSVVMISV